MGAGGRHWGLLVHKFRVSACAGGDVKSSIQNAAREGKESQEAEEPSSDQKELWVEYELIQGEGEGSEPGLPETDLLLEGPDKVSYCVLGFVSNGQNPFCSNVPLQCMRLELWI